MEVEDKAPKATCKYSELKPELREERDRCIQIALKIHSGVIRGIDMALQYENHQSPFINYGAALINVYEEIGRLQCVEIAYHLAQQPHLTRKQMKQVLKGVHDNLTDWFKSALTKALDEAADGFDQARAQCPDITKQ